jgi:chromosome segregation ATPase
MKLKDAENIKIPEPVDLMIYEDLIQTFDNEIGEARKRIEEIETNSAELKERFDTARRKLDEYNQNNKQHVEKIQELKNQYNALDQDRTSHKEAVNYYKKMFDDHSPKEKQIDEKLASEETELAVINNSLIQIE